MSVVEMLKKKKIMKAINKKPLQKKHSSVIQDLELRCTQCTVILVHSRRVDSYICRRAAAQNYRSPTSCDSWEYFMTWSFNDG